jgi:hypothetical protein
LFHEFGEGLKVPESLSWLLLATGLAGTGCHPPQMSLRTVNLISRWDEEHNLLRKSLELRIYRKSLAE